MNWLNVPSTEPLEDYLPDYPNPSSGENDDFPYFLAPETDVVDRIELPAA